MRRVALGEQARAHDLDGVHEHVDLDGGAGGVVAVAQRVGNRLADGLGRDLGDLLAVHARLADDELAPDVRRHEVLGEVEQLEHGAALAAQVEDLGLGVAAQKPQLHPGVGVGSLAEQLHRGVS